MTLTRMAWSWKRALGARWRAFMENHIVADAPAYAEPGYHVQLHVGDDGKSFIMHVPTTPAPIPVILVGEKA